MQSRLLQNIVILMVACGALIPDYIFLPLGEAFPRITVTRLILIASFFLCSIAAIGQKPKLHFPYFWLILSILLFTLINLLYNPLALSNQLKAWFAIVESFVIYYGVSNLVVEEVFLRKFLKALMVCVVVLSILAIVEQIRGKSLDDGLQVGKAWINQDLIPRIRGDELLRSKGTFRYSNSFGALLTLGIAPCLVFSKLSRTQIGKLISSLALLLNLIGLFFTFSRGPWISTVCAICFLFFLSRDLRKPIVILASLMIISLTLILLVSEDVQRMGKIALLSEESYATVELRKQSARFAFVQFSNNPLTGIGLGSLLKLPYTGNPADNPVHRLTDNHYLQILGEQGLFGLALFLLLYMFLLMDLKRAIHKVKNNSVRNYILCLGSGIVSLLIVNFTMDSLLNIPLSLFFWSYAGITKSILIHRAEIT